MLVLSRKNQEQILIPGLDIRITILNIGSNRVQLGIDAPRGIEITRPETTRPPAATMHDERIRHQLECRIAT